MRLFHQVAYNLIIKVINILPSDAFPSVFFLLLLEHQFYILERRHIKNDSLPLNVKKVYTDEELLQFFITIVYAKLFETINVKNLKTINVQDTNDSSWNVGILIFLLYFNSTIHTFNNPAKKPIV